MAYKANFNPDALPAHVEPHQAAQLLGQPYPQSSASSLPTSSSNHSSEPAWKNKPPPPLPPLPGQQQPPSRTTNSVSPRLDANYNRPPHSTSPVYGSYPPPQQPPGAYPQQHGPSPGPYAGQQQNYQGRPYANSVGQAQRPGPPSQISSSGAGGGIPLAGSDPGLFPIFRSVDSNGSGQLSEEELGRALKNGDYTSFDIETVRMMIKMFDHDQSGSIGFEEFCGLWGFLGAWRQLFDRFDEDRSGYISFNEYTNALVAFGYHLTPKFVGTLYSIYGRRRAGEMSFDLFVQSCISLKRMTDVFKRYDTDRDGFITLSFEEFLTGQWKDLAPVAR